MANSIGIILPNSTLLKCRLNTTILEFEGNDVRTIGEICEYRRTLGLQFLIEHLPREKDRSWWDHVESIAANFSWDEYRDPERPQVKPEGGTLEFSKGNHRAMALAMHGDRILNGADNIIEVDLCF